MMRIFYTFVIILSIALQSNAQSSKQSEFNAFFNEYYIAKATDSTYLVHINLIRSANQLFVEHKNLKIITKAQEERFVNVSELIAEKNTVIEAQAETISMQLISSKMKDDVIQSKTSDIHKLQNDIKTISKKQLLPWVIAGASAILTVITAIR